jgi:hypothetical protein
MALISCTVSPYDDVRTTDIEGSRGRIVGFEIDGITIYLATFTEPEEKDAAIVATANMLIGVLVGLRDAAARRIADKPNWTESELAYGR